MACHPHPDAEGSVPFEPLAQATISEGTDLTNSGAEHPSQYLEKENKEHLQDDTSKD